MPLGHSFPRLPVIDPEGSDIFTQGLWDQIYECVEPWQEDNQHFWLLAPEERVSLYELASGYHSQSQGYVLEFGSWCCATAVMLAKALIKKNDPYLPVITVDPYKYYPNNPFSPELITYLESHRMHQRFGDEVYYGIVRVVSEDLSFMRLWNNPIRLAFIDTTGQYDHTKDEMEACLPFMVDDSWLVFHDYYEPYQDGLIDVVDEFVENQTEWEIQPYRMVDEICEYSTMVGIHLKRRI